MNEAELAAFEVQLRKMQSELNALESASRASAATVVLDQTSMGRLTRMDAMQGQQMALEAERRRASQLVQINLALQRIAQGSFGYCAVCDNEIGVRRLAINPAVTRCVHCSD